MDTDQQQPDPSGTPETPDEAALLQSYAAELAQGLARTVPQWAQQCIATAQQRSAVGTGDGDWTAAQVAAAALAADTVVPEVQRLLEADVDGQWTSPLDVVRRLVPELTEMLSTLGAVPVPRDPGTAELLPEDVFGLTPATFADIDPSLHEPGLAWGAAKAHIHLRRHGHPDEAGESAGLPMVVVFAPDLGDRSRFDGFDVTHIRSAGKLEELADSDEPDLVIVDLDRTSAPADFLIENAHVIGFGSHVDSDRHEAALDAGFDAVMARSIFFRRLPELLAPVAKGA